ncbi:peptidoglycan-binding protein [Tuanshanicoccus lijuaniae]|uniref:peptidoglycan-binding protein n=1 Tax=Aerococcaceae bacterium zg-1292 TaxID=2774330 RepID=UPI001937F663|nr:peptidoglycan-binding protein [Aerococcaceae bacterium zg-1292]QQA36736.1 peptidoglycan-binding protein [Aerococcaceae bacterium zg-1292]
MKLSKVLVSSLLVLSAAAVAVPVAQQATGDIAIVQAQEDAYTIYRYYTAAHGDKAFTAVSVLAKGDTIVDTIIDEFQFTAADNGFTGVPNADGDFGAGFAEGQVLFSKLENNEAYSKLMAEKGGSTVAYADNFAAIVEQVKGKTVEEVRELATKVEDLGEDGDVSEVVSGATLADTANYLKAIADATEKGIAYTGVASDSEEVILKQALSAPHGTKSFALISTAVSSDKIVAAAIDEFQISDAGGFEGVPNSDGAFAEGLADGKVLFSKVVNQEAYSKLMAEKGGSTVDYLTNLTAIAEYTYDKTIDEVKAGIEELDGLGEDGKVADVVSGATLADASGYLQAIVDLATK